MGSVINMEPELFNAAVIKVPFVDVVNSMLDETIPLTVTEFEEWGNPKEAKMVWNLHLVVLFKLTSNYFLNTIANTHLV